LFLIFNVLKTIRKNPFAGIKVAKRESQNTKKRKYILIFE